MAGTPLALRVFASASGLDALAFDRALSQLRAGRLVRTDQRASADIPVEAYHDRVCEAVVSSLDAARRAPHHRALALCLESAGGSAPELLTAHWKGAGDRVRGARYAVLSAEHALAALAFDQAASYYRQALETVPGQPDARSLRIKLGDALAKAGRGGDAADTYLAIEAGEDALELRGRAAEQLLRCGRVDEGIDLAQQVLAGMGIRFTQRPRLVLQMARLLWLRIRGLRFRSQPAEQLDDGMLRRLDLGTQLAHTLGTADGMIGFSLNARLLLLALRIGDPVRVAEKMAVMGAIEAVSGAFGRAERLIERAREVVQGSGPPQVRAFINCAVYCFHLTRGHFREGLAEVEQAERLFRDECQGRSYEVALSRFFQTHSLYFLGELRRLRACTAQWRADSADRGDRYGDT